MNIIQTSISKNRFYRKIKILFISHSPHFNGAEICLFTLIKNIDRSLFEPIVVFPYPGPLHKVVKSLGIKIYISPLERWIRYKYDKPIPNSDLQSRTQMIIKIIEKESIDIVHTNTSVILEGALASKIKNVPHIWHVHENIKESTELNPCLPIPITYEFMSHLSSKIISVSNFVKEQFNTIINEKLITTIYNGVKENKASVNNELRNKLGIKNDEIIAITVGVLSEAKGFDNLLNAATIVRDKGIKIKFLWVGGEINKNLKDFNKKVKKLGLKDSVSYLGFRNDIPELLKSSDFLICTSVMETLSLVILEAMAARIPVITTECGGPSECVIDNVSGFIVPINDSNRLSDKIIEISSDRVKRNRFGMNGLKRFVEYFRENLYIEKFEDLYVGIINENTDKTVSDKERNLIESFFQIYNIFSDHHWKALSKLR